MCPEKRTAETMPNIGKMRVYRENRRKDLSGRAIAGMSSVSVYFQVKSSLLALISYLTFSGSNRKETAGSNFRCAAGCSF
jgi:hypothetical protein